MACLAYPQRARRESVCKKSQLCTAEEIHRWRPWGPSHPLLPIIPPWNGIAMPLSFNGFWLHWSETCIIYIGFKASTASWLLIRQITKQSPTLLEWTLVSFTMLPILHLNVIFMILEGRLDGDGCPPQTIGGLHWASLVTAQHLVIIFFSIYRYIPHFLLERIPTAILAIFHWLNSNFAIAILAKLCCWLNSMLPQIVCIMLKEIKYFLWAFSLHSQTSLD